MSTDLTAMAIKNLKPRPTAYYVTDGRVKNLQIRIAPDGSRSWSIRYRDGRGRQRRHLMSVA